MSALEKTLRWIVIAGLFAVPLVALIVSDSLFFPYITGKNFAFRIIVELMAGAWLALAIVEPKYRPRRSWILGCFAIFVFVMAIADLQGVMPFKSFWSNFERMDGWITIAHTLLLLVVGACMIESESLWRRLFHWSLLISGFLSVLGLLQIAGILDFGSGGTGLSARVDATFGNPIYLAVYMLFNVFIAVLLWAQEGGQVWKTEDRWLLPLGSLVGLFFIIQQLSSHPGGNTGHYIGVAVLFYVLFLVAVELLMSMQRRYVLALVIALDTVALLFSGTRGATLGLILGGLLAFVVYALSRDASRRVRYGAVTLCVLAIVGGAGLKLAQNTPLVQNIGFLNRLSSLSLQDDTTQARLINIQIAWQGIKERPILGWGQENYAIVFDKYYDPRMYAQEQWFDRVHNIIFDWWIAGGTLGILAYLSIFGATLWALWRKGNFSASERAILTGLLAGYFIHNITVFDNVTSYILFALVLGYIVHRERSASHAAPLFAQVKLSAKSLPIVAGICGVLALGSVWFVNANAYAANLDIISGLSVSSAASLPQNLAAFQDAIGYGTYGTQEAREQLAQISMSVAQAQVPVSTKESFVTVAVQQLDLQAQASPLDARFPLFAGTLLALGGDFKDATTELARAHQLSPDKQTILFALGQVAQAQGDSATALQYFQTAYQLDTQDTDARTYYAAALVAAGRTADARALLAQVMTSAQVDQAIAQMQSAKTQ